MDPDLESALEFQAFDHRTAIFVAFGNFEYLLNTSVAISHHVNLQELLCLDTTNNHIHAEITAYINRMRGKRKLVVIRGVEYLYGDSAKVLDPIFKYTDNSSPVADLVIVLHWDTEVKPAPGEMRGTGNELKDALAQRWNSDSRQFNGKAFTGRISKVLFDSAPIPSSVLNSDRSCATITAGIKSRSSTSGSSSSMLLFPYSASSLLSWSGSLIAISRWKLSFDRVLIADDESLAVMCIIAFLLYVFVAAVTPSCHEVRSQKTISKVHQPMDSINSSNSSSSNIVDEVKPVIANEGLPAQIVRSDSFTSSVASSVDIPYDAISQRTRSHKKKQGRRGKSRVRRA